MTTEPKRCSEDHICHVLESRLVDSGKGFKALHAINMTTGNFRLLGVAYKQNAKDKGLLLNVCPWCRGEPGSFKRNTAMPKETPA